MSADHRALHLVQTVLDCEDPRQLAEFYRELLGLRYRRGDEPPALGGPDPRGQDWLVLIGENDEPRLAFQGVATLPPASWPDGPVPQQLHLDMSVTTPEDFHAEHARALSLGAKLLRDRSDDPDEPLHVYADPASHPFCIFVAGPKAGSASRP